MECFERFYEKQREKHLSTEDIKSIIEHCVASEKIVSFDVFDTLLMRPSMQPADIFYLLQKKVKDTFNLDFCALRLHAEEELKDDCATIIDIWTYIGKKNHLSPETVVALCEMEKQLEIDLSIARSDVKELYDSVVAQGIRVIAVSDIYLPSDTIRQMLNKNGYHHIDAIYVSCEKSARKSTGELFDVVLKEEKITNLYGMIHIGDNFVSDCKIPLSKGIVGVFYPGLWNTVMGPDAWRRKIYSHPVFSADPYTRILSSFSLVHRLAKGAPVEGAISDLSALTDEFIAPIAIAAACNILNDESIQKDYSVVNFAARDGYLPNFAYNYLSARAGGLSGRYLYVSRMALGWCSFHSFADLLSKSDVMERYDLEGFLKSYLFDPSALTAALAELSEDEKHLNLNTHRIYAVGILRRIEPVIQPFFLQEKALAEEYYRSLFADCGARSIIFDCGYSGSVSIGLMRALQDGHPVDKFYLWETEKNKTIDRNTGTRTKCLFRDNMTPYLGLNLFYEEVFSPLTGTCIGFSKKSGDIVPVFETCSFSAEMCRDLENIKSALEDYLRSFSSLFEPYLNEFYFSNAVDIASALKNLLQSQQSDAVHLLRHISFRDVVLRGEDKTLEEKVYQSLLHNGLAGTGFDDAANYIEEPLPAIPATPLRIAIHLHLYNKHLYGEILMYLKEFPLPFDLIVTVVDDTFGEIIKSAYTQDTIPQLRRLIVIIVENRGRDVAPWIIATKDYQADYDYICHIHGKESIQYGPGIGDRWRNYLFANLLSPRAVLNIIHCFEVNLKLGCIFPKVFDCIASIFTNGICPVEETEKKMIEILLREKIRVTECYFSAGTMFWYRPCALMGLFQAEISLRAFPEEPIPVGGTLAHAIERCPALFADRAGFESKFFTQYEETAAQTTGGHFFVPSTGVRGAFKVYIDKHIPWRRKNVRQENIGLKNCLVLWLLKKVFGKDVKIYF